MERLYPREYGPTTLREPETTESNVAFKIIYNTGGTPEKPISMEELMTFPIENDDEPESTDSVAPAAGN